MQHVIFEIEYWKDGKTKLYYFDEKLQQKEDEVTVGFCLAKFYVTSEKCPDVESIPNYIKKIISHELEIAEHFQCVNLKYVRHTARRIARQILYDIFKNLHGTEHVLFDSEWDLYEIKTDGALIYSDQKYQEFTGFSQFDINSKYPAIYLDDDFQFPIRKGKVVKLPDDIRDIDTDECAFYEIHVKTEKCGRIFKKNIDNVYTNYDLKSIQRHKLEHEFLCDEYYKYENKDCINLAFFLKKTVDKLYELKKAGNLFAKEILNCIWGTLCQAYIINVLESSPQWKQFKDNNRIKINGWHRELKYAEYYSIERPFKFTFGRMKPFILSYARYTISKDIRKIMLLGYKVIRVHTDSILTDIDEKTFNDKVHRIGKELGDYKNEINKIDPKQIYVMKNVNSICPK